MGGIDIDFPSPMSGYDEGLHHLDGTQALALVRDRAGTDDFFRMERGQLFIRSAILAFTNPLILPRLPAILIALPAAAETDLPIWQWPRIALAMLRAGPDGIDGRTISREMATGFFTADGANVLLPNWDLINPMVDELFP
jgi:anionic cell wall polymer biosynthesis LytR-Cps2A-Psr (LCP) family protein